MKNEEIEEFLNEQGDELSGSEKLEPESEHVVVGNHTGYPYPGGENYEHDDTGSIQNYSGVEDEVFSSIAEHEDWKEGYDY
ncbi:hypothetical protein [Endozoicomonas atrinae]|uniref:hypothetical protein n=1 Tax=Endozoicomonas atrinae TaxID=1333660 RepID=UPI003B00B0C0